MILDAMKLLHMIWSVNGNYAREGGIKRCWSKANIIKPIWNININNIVVI